MAGVLPEDAGELPPNNPNDTIMSSVDRRCVTNREPEQGQGRCPDRFGLHFESLFLHSNPRPGDQIINYWNSSSARARTLANARSISLDSCVWFLILIWHHRHPFICIQDGWSWRALCRTPLQAGSIIRTLLIGKIVNSLLSSQRCCTCKSGEMESCSTLTSIYIVFTMFWKRLLVLTTFKHKNLLIMTLLNWDACHRRAVWLSKIWTLFLQSPRSLHLAGYWSTMRAKSCVLLSPRLL